MNLSVELNLRVGEIKTYAYIFQNASREFQTEYIHYIIIELLSDESGDKSKRIKVNQIHNLESYFLNPASYDHFSTRILKTDSITELIGTRV